MKGTFERTTNAWSLRTEDPRDKGAPKHEVNKAHGTSLKNLVSPTRSLKNDLVLLTRWSRDLLELFEGVLPRLRSRPVISDPALVDSDYMNSNQLADVYRPE